METIARFFRPPRQSYFLFGPRGTGKTRLVQDSYPKALRLDLLDPEVFRALSGRPERLREFVAGHVGQPIAIIDEVQKVPEILSVVHALIEENRRFRCVLTGSSARKLTRAGTDLLAGRALLRTLHPFMAGELGDDFSLRDALLVGLLPVIVAAERPADALKAYHAMYLKEEVQQEGLVRNLGGFVRFLEAMSFSHAAVLNMSNIARECEVGRKTVEGFVQILEDLLLGFRLPVFTRRAKRATADHPKFYFFDAGVFRSLRPRGLLDSSDEIEGAALEGLVAQHLRAWNAYRNDPNALYCWRTRGGTEVDFVVYGPDGFWAIEVKNARKVFPGDVRGLKTFAADYPESRPLLLYRGDRRLEVDGVACLPCEVFLRQLAPGRAGLAR